MGRGVIIIYLPHPLNPPLHDMDIYSYHEGEIKKGGLAPLLDTLVSRDAEQEGERR